MSGSILQCSFRPSVKACEGVGGGAHTGTQRWGIQPGGWSLSQWDVRVGFGKLFLVRTSHCSQCIILQSHRPFCTRGGFVAWTANHCIPEADSSTSVFVILNLLLLLFAVVVRLLMLHVMLVTSFFYVLLLLCFTTRHFCFNRKPVCFLDRCGVAFAVILSCGGIAL